MIEFINGLKSLLKIKRVHIDNWIMRLNYSFTVIILLIFCTIICTKEFSGDPIDCLLSRNELIPKNVINTYCWTLVTFNIPSSLNKVVGIDVPYPGIGYSETTKDFRYFYYYQWIWFVLFIQATFFFAPRWLWKNWEGGLMENLILNSDDKKITKNTDYIVDYLRNSIGKHNFYAIRFLFCEFLTFLNIIIQFYLLNWLFDGDFYTYGLDVINYYKNEHTIKSGSINPMIVLFPKMTKCRFFKYGPSSNLETYDALCLLPLNVINDKIYLFIWFWFLFLSIITSISFFFHILLFFFPGFRLNVFRKTLIGLNLKEDEIYFEYITKIFPSFGDWFILYMLRENVNLTLFYKILKELKPRKYNSID